MIQPQRVIKADVLPSSPPQKQATGGIWRLLLKYNDHILYIVVCTMAVSYVVCQAAALWLGWHEKAVPDFIIQSGGQSGGALLAILLAVNTVITRQNANGPNHYAEDIKLPIRREKHGE